ncbi:MAG TPA: hypothetical protein VF243_05925, partial [Nitrosospira sp.]
VHRLGFRRLRSRFEAPLISALSRQEKLDISCRLQVPVGEVVATRPYRVLRPWRSQRYKPGTQDGQSVDSTWEALDPTLTAASTFEPVRKNRPD